MKGGRGEERTKIRHFYSFRRPYKTAGAAAVASESGFSKFHLKLKNKCRERSLGREGKGKGTIRKKNLVFYRLPKMAAFWQRGFACCQHLYPRPHA